MLEDQKKGLYPNCKDGKTKLGTILELLQWKIENVVPDKGFEKLLKILKKKLPKDNELPDSTYATKKVVLPLGHISNNRSIPHHLRRNPLPGGLAVNITRVISSDLILQCTAYRHAFKSSYAPR